jgi:hypothetical protein
VPNTQERGLIVDAEKPQRLRWERCRKPATLLPWPFVNFVEDARIETSSSQVVAMMQANPAGHRNDPVIWACTLGGDPSCRSLFPQSEMSPVVIVVADVLANQPVPRQNSIRAEKRGFDTKKHLRPGKFIFRSTCASPKFDLGRRLWGLTQ